MIRIKDIAITADILNKISEIDKFNSSWNVDGLRLSPAELTSMKRVATIESVGSSNRIEGNKLSDAEIEELFSHISKKSFRSRDEEEVAGYSDLINTIFENYEDIALSENYIKQLHKILLKYSQKDERHRGEYKKASNSVAAYDEAGNEIGVIFQTAAPFDTPRLMRELLQWTKDTFNDRYLHPLLTIGVFIVHFLAIHPFTDGNGRLSRALTILLMLKNNYGYMPYASMESVIEANKEAYYKALHDTQKTIGSEKTDYEPWLSFFITALQKQKRALEAKIKNLQKPDTHLTSSLQVLPTHAALTQVSSTQLSSVQLSATAREILSVFTEKEELTMAELIEKTKKNAGTIRKSVQNLVKKGFLIKLGTTQGASYTLKK